MKMKECDATFCLLCAICLENFVCVDAQNKTAKLVINIGN